jgi:hypothetical protein
MERSVEFLAEAKKFFRDHLTEWIRFQVARSDGSWSSTAAVFIDQNVPRPIPTSFATAGSMQWCVVLRYKSHIETLIDDGADCRAERRLSMSSGSGF